MKKITVVTMAMLLALACTACGSENADYEGGQITELNQEENAAETSEDVAEDLAEENEEEVVEEGNDFALGRIQGGVYTNEYFGGACELDSSWTFYSAEELQELPEDIYEMVKDTDMGEGVAELEQIIDMQAECAEDLTNMNIAYQKLSAQERLAYMAMDEEAIMDTLLSASDMMKESYAQAGIIVDEMSVKTVTFLGKERLALYTKAQTEGTDCYMLQLFDFHLGEYSVTYTFNSFLEDKTEDLLALFYAL